jgi:pimeloyl-ACP methyl ester carboxylesterase
MGEIKPTLERAGFYVGPTSFGKFGVPRFLSPLKLLRNRAVSRVVSDIRTARRSHKLATGSEPKYMSVISHSFGTYVVSRIVADYPEFQWERIIFCGSVVREDFRFDQVLERFRHPLLNEVGTRDYWPALAESLGWGYGSVGSTGFNRPPVETRWHKGFRHSDFLTEKFCDDFWVPFLRGEKARQGDKATELPLRIRAITWFPVRWLGVALWAAAILFAGQAIWESMGHAPTVGPTSHTEVTPETPSPPVAPTSHTAVVPKTPSPSVAPTSPTAVVPKTPSPSVVPTSPTDSDDGLPVAHHYRDSFVPR